jgi:hypothetical protein
MCTEIMVGISFNGSEYNLTPLYTRQMLGSLAFTGSGWTITEGLYPRLADPAGVGFDMDGNDAALLWSNPVLLEGAGMGTDTVSSVTRDFTVGTATGVSWTSSAPTIVSISGSAAHIESSSSAGVTLTATLGDFTRTVTIAKVTRYYDITYLANGGVGTAPFQDRLVEGATFTVCSASGLSRTGYTLSPWDDGSNTYAPGDTYTVGTSDVTFTAIWQANTPDAPALESKTDTTVTVTAVTGQEYAIQKATDTNYGSWQSGNTFTGLSAGTAYQVVCRVAASGSDLASAPSAALDVTTKSGAPTTPAAPVLESKTDVSITVTAVTGQEYAIKSDTDANYGAWQDGGNFTGLTANTAYHIITRIKETADTAPSAQSAALNVTTKNAAPTTPAAPVLDSKTDVSITVTTVTGAGICLQNRLRFQLRRVADGGVFTGLTAGTEYHNVTRVKETADTMPSASSAALNVHDQNAAPATPARAGT